MVKRILMCAVVTVCVAGLSFAGQQDNQNKKSSSQSSSTQSSANPSGSGQNSSSQNASSQKNASQNSASQNNSSKSASSWTGWITDSDCGAKGASANHADCARKCVSDKGAKYVLYNSSNKKTYNLDDQAAAAEHVAHIVKVKGSLDGDTIHVQSITASASKQKSASSNDKSGS